MLDLAHRILGLSPAAPATVNWIVGCARHRRVHPHPESPAEKASHASSAGGTHPDMRLSSNTSQHPQWQSSVPTRAAVLRRWLPILAPARRSMPHRKGHGNPILPLRTRV